MIITSFIAYVITLQYASIIDIRKQMIYDRVHIIIIVLSVLTLSNQELLINFLGAAIISIPFLMLALKTDKLGGGDIKLIFCNNLFLGFWTGYAGVVIGLAIIILFYVVKWKAVHSKNRAVPMAPFLSGGYMISLILGKLLS
jgi:leader peptidase (prepilin peptidase)/N-methyltransferase